MNSALLNDLKAQSTFLILSLASTASSYTILASETASLALLTVKKEKF
jgi:hypothetical protein